MWERRLAIAVAVQASPSPSPTLQQLKLGSGHSHRSKLGSEGSEDAKGPCHVCRAAPSRLRFGREPRWINAGGKNYFDEHNFSIVMS